MIVSGAEDPTALCRWGNRLGFPIRTERVAVSIRSGLNLLGAVEALLCDAEFLSCTSEVERDRLLLALLVSIGSGRNLLVGRCSLGSFECISGFDRAG